MLSKHGRRGQQGEVGLLGAKIYGRMVRMAWGLSPPGPLDISSQKIQFRMGSRMQRPKHNFRSTKLNMIQNTEKDLLPAL